MYYNNHTLIVFNKRREKLRMNFVGKNARGEAFSLLCELQHKHGNDIGYIESNPRYKEYKTADAALGDAKSWVEH